MKAKYKIHQGSPDIPAVCLCVWREKADKSGFCWHILMVGSREGAERRMMEHVRENVVPRYTLYPPSEIYYDENGKRIEP